MNRSRNVSFAPCRSFITQVFQQKLLQICEVTRTAGPRRFFLELKQLYHIFSPLSTAPLLAWLSSGEWRLDAIDRTFLSGLLRAGFVGRDCWPAPESTQVALPLGVLQQIGPVKELALPAAPRSAQEPPT
ncbi:hypothetical protein MHYP_G00021140 [Metynnis hypsauchen]